MHQTQETAHGKFQFLSPDRCFFRRKFHWYERSSFPLKGTIVWSGDQARIKARAPVGGVAFCASMAVAWASAAFSPLFSEGEGNAALAMGLSLGAAAFIGVMLIAALIMEKDRAEVVVRELAELLAVPEGEPATAAGEPKVA